MKRLKPILLIFCLLIIYIYTCNIVYIPNSIIVFQGENIQINTLFGLKVEQISGSNLRYGAMQTSTGTSESTSENIGNANLSLNLFGTIPLKEINVNVISQTTVIPLGNAIGLRLYTEGVLVVGMSEVEGQKPYANTGIKEGDTIVEINKEEIENTTDLIEEINKSKGETVEMKYKRNEETITTSITPIKNSKNEYKLGLWVRDAAAGVGTATFYEPSTGKIAALGHGITDIDTGEIVKISTGDLLTSTILSIVKGEKRKSRRNKRNN